MPVKGNLVGRYLSMASVILFTRPHHAKPNRRRLLTMKNILTVTIISLFSSIGANPSVGQIPGQDGIRVDPLSSRGVSRIENFPTARSDDRVTSSRDSGGDSSRALKIIRMGSSRGSGASRGEAYAEAISGVPLGAVVYRRLNYGNNTHWNIVLYWKIER